MRETIREMAYLIKLPIENWLEDTEAISPATTYYAELLSCINDSAEELYNAGYRKVPEGGCVLSKEENENWVKWLEQNVKQARKETAREILQEILLMVSHWDGRNVHINHDELVEFGKKYDVDMRVVEE